MIVIASESLGAWKPAGLLRKQDRHTKEGKIASEL